MVLIAKPWYHAAIICAKKKKVLTQQKNCKKVEISVHYNFKLQLLFNTILTFTNNITYLA